MRMHLALFLLILFLLSPSMALAEGEGLDIVGGVPHSPSPELIGVRPLGMGGAGIALANGMEGLLLNPAGLRMLKPSIMAEAGGYFNTGANSFTLNAGMVDNKSNRLVAGGASYSFFVDPREDDGKIFTVSGHMVRLGLAMSMQNTLYLGVNIKYANLTRPFVIPNHYINADVGLTWRIVKPLTLAVVGYNLLYNDSGEFPISLGMGVAFDQSFGGNHAIRLAFDSVLDFTRPGGLGYELRTGLEYVFGKILGIRFGYAFDEIRKVRDTPRQYFTVGLTFKFQRFGLEFGYRQQLSNAPLDANRRFGVTARLYL